MHTQLLSTTAKESKKKKSNSLHPGTHHGESLLPIIGFNCAVVSKIRENALAHHIQSLKTMRQYLQFPHLC